MYDQLTQGDIDKMKAEIKHRKEVVRWELLEAVKTARAQGDLSENFEYYAAKREKNRNESRIRYLERMIKTARIIDDNAADDAVGLNNRVTVRIEDDGSEETYRIVTTVRGDVLDGLISNVSPVGRALLGKKVGDLVTVKVDDSFSYDMTILSIDKTADESEDKIKAY
jgi:transcription elongation factor GreA